METITPHIERLIAVQAAVDPRTVRRYLAGRPIRSTCQVHIEQALIALKRSDLVRVN